MKKYDTIKEMRLALGMTQKAFAKNFGFTYSAVRSWEGGYRKTPAAIMKLMQSYVMPYLLNDNGKERELQKIQTLGSGIWACEDMFGEPAIFHLVAGRVYWMAYGRDMVDEELAIEWYGGSMKRSEWPYNYELGVPASLEDRKNFRLLASGEDFEEEE